MLWKWYKTVFVCVCVWLMLLMFVSEVNPYSWWEYVEHLFSCVVICGYTLVPLTYGLTFPQSVTVRKQMIVLLAYCQIVISPVMLLQNAYITPLISSHYYYFTLIISILASHIITRRKVSIVQYFERESI